MWPAEEEENGEPSQITGDEPVNVSQQKPGRKKEKNSLPPALGGKPSQAESKAANKIASAFYSVEASSRSAPGSATPFFASELLDKAPSSIQTCNGLLTFLQKRLSAAHPPPPEVGGGPDAPCKDLKTHADLVGRLASLESSDGWDIRAKRVLDVCSYGATSSGQEKINAARVRIKASLAEVEDCYEALGNSAPNNVNELTHERREWAHACARRDWLTWCVKLLNARTEMLAATEASPKASKKKKAKTAQPVDMSYIFESLLTGKNLP